MEWIHDLVLRDDTPEDWLHRRERIRARIAGVLGPTPDEKVPLDVEVLEEETCDGYVRRKITYATESWDRVPAYLLIPEDADTPRPAVLCFHGTGAPGKAFVMGMTERQNRAYAPELAQRGYVTLAPDVIAMGERVLPGAEALDVAPFYERFPGRTVEAKNLWDHRCAVDLLASLPEVDAGRIGAMGHSLGGRSTHYLAAFDERVASAVISCGIIPMGTYTDLFRQRNKWDPFPTRRTYIQEHGRLPFEKHEITALVAPRPLMLISPANDGPCPRTDQISIMAHRVFEVYRLLGKDANLARYVHGDGHDTTPFVRKIMYGWLDLHLKADASSGKE